MTRRYVYWIPRIMFCASILCVGLGAHLAAVILLKDDFAWPQSAIAAAVVIALAAYSACLAVMWRRAFADHLEFPE